MGKSSDGMRSSEGASSDQSYSAAPPKGKSRGRQMLWRKGAHDCWPELELDLEVRAQGVLDAMASRRCGRAGGGAGHGKAAGGHGARSREGRGQEEIRGVGVLSGSSCSCGKKQREEELPPCLEGVGE
jgi:hypothetical protein